MHDGLIQDLSALGLALEIDSRRTGTVDQHAALAERVRDDIGELRGVLDDLHPQALEPGDLREAFTAAARDLDTPTPPTETGAPLTMVTGREPTLIYRCGLELLRNAVAHSGASEVVVELLDCDGTVGVEVRDDGAGFDPEQVPAGHHGLRLVRAPLPRPAHGWRSTPPPLAPPPASSCDPAAGADFSGPPGTRHTLGSRDHHLDRARVA